MNVPANTNFEINRISDIKSQNENVKSDFDDGDVEDMKEIKALCLEMSVQKNTPYMYKKVMMKQRAMPKKVPSQSPLI